MTASVGTAAAERRYVVIGAGAVGATLAAELHTAGIATVLVARGAHLDALRAGGLRYLRPDGEHVVDVPVAAGPAEVDLRAGDVLVLATKAQDAESTIADWAWRPVKGGLSAAESLPVLVLQNGLDTELVALRRFATVYGAAVWSPSTYLVPGEVESPAAPAVGIVWVGRFPGGHDARLAPIADDLRAARHLVEVVEDIPRWRAGKLLGIVVNALDALYRPSPLRDRVAAALSAEAREVYAAAGRLAADLPADTTLDLSQFVSHPIPGRPPAGRSTWQSLQRGASLESDFLNGEIVLLARLHGVDAPHNAAALARIRRAEREGTTAGSLGDDDLRATFPRLDVLVDAAALAAELAGPRPPVLLDVRWALGDPHGREHHRDGHLPGAVYVDLDTELAAPVGDPLAGRHPLPDIADLQDAARRWGVSTGRPVVAYDATGGLAAGRAWWLLRWAGLTDVRLLDGGLGAWVAAGLPVETGAVPEPGTGDVELSPGHLPVLDADGAADLARSGLLLDARAAERYRGETEPIDLRAGHVPGAVSAPTGDNLAPDGRFRPAAELRARVAELGEGPVGVYCGSGVTAAHEIAALAAAGIPAALFPGSWSAWSSDPARPVAVGPDPDGS
ncbi:rhodanese-like domain-containing protein [Pseudonocardia dioxanivorans]|uniref:rhodanese-like domain-containing protein n=1 Tax=Pseudonocardia dioxanivorans TaxID=240495 RepID=UPI000CD1EF9D|nr:rhodanese-like domain-containing protein [Pseudonocardia dioxanivorans]